MIKVSFIVPVYNVEERYLRICLQSLIDIRSENIEIIVINDGSTDNSIDICKEYGNKDERIKLISKENTGVSDTRYMGIDYSNGEYITFVDADDWIDSDNMDKILEYVMDSKMDIIAYGQYIDFKNKEKIEVRPFDTSIKFESKKLMEKLEKMVFVREYDSMKTSLGSGVICNAVDKFINKSKLNGLKFNKNIKIGEDSLFYLELYNQCDTFEYIDICAYHYRMRASSANNTVKGIGYNDLKIFFTEGEKILKIKNMDRQIHEALYCRCYDLIFEQYDKAYGKANIFLFKKINLFSKDVYSYPIKKCIKVVKIKNMLGKDKVKLILFKLHLGAFFVIIKEIKKKIGNNKNGKLYY